MEPRVAAFHSDIVDLHLYSGSYRTRTELGAEGSEERIHGKHGSEDGADTTATDWVAKAFMRNHITRSKHRCRKHRR
jgi:hypothetical protein